ncbi:hypothetical protein K505DRAFT_323964 [Melanomma pulvis-pyrius CBS 109.77]|uniref:Uncharacterized protein n=1 Tax=Melanomma pulvis-pyrius CBS 109.77 TaxID=1314802 RepID=A0A6A6XH61_9PLEO|nr:hypothetical protein K505DRAFT_323964 [Melanomma pulvis-pyrius CBS 109.77]
MAGIRQYYYFFYLSVCLSVCVSLSLPPLMYVDPQNPSNSPENAECIRRPNHKT